MVRTYWNQTHALLKINEKINCGIRTLHQYQIKGIIEGPDCIFKHGTRDMPGYSDERIAEIIERIRMYRTKSINKTIRDNNNIPTPTDDIIVSET